MANSPIYNLPLPNTTSTDQVPADLMTFTTAAEKMFVGQFASASARDAKITAPVGGMTCWLASPGCYSEYLGSGWKNRYSTGVQFWNLGWPDSTLPGSNGIGTPTQTVTPNIGPYLLRVSVGCGFSAAGSATGLPLLQLYCNGAQRATEQCPTITSTMSPYYLSLSREFSISDGSTTSVFARINIPAGTTVQTYSDDTTSYMSISVQPM